MRQPPSINSKPRPRPRHFHAYTRKHSFSVEYNSSWWVRHHSYVDEINIKTQGTNED